MLRIRASPAWGHHTSTQIHTGTHIDTHIPVSRYRTGQNSSSVTEQCLYNRADRTMHPSRFPPSFQCHCKHRTWHSMDCPPVLWRRYRTVGERKAALNGMRERKTLLAFQRAANAGCWSIYRAHVVVNGSLLLLWCRGYEGEFLLVEILSL